MTPQFSHGRALTSASHLAGGFTASGAFITPRLRQMHQQQAADQHTKLARTVLPFRVLHLFHVGGSTCD